jgi:hypothetical protein
MTYYVTALKNDNSRLFLKDMRTTCKETAETVAINWENQGHIVIERKEG